MISRTAFCSAHPDTMRVARIGPIPETSVRRSGVGFDDLEGIDAEGRHDTFGHGRSNAAHLSGGQILLDALRPGWRRGLEHLGLELEAVGAVTDPDATGGDPFAGGDTWGMANHRYEVPFSTGMDLQHGEAILGIVVGDALDRACEGLQDGSANQPVKVETSGSWCLPRRSLSLSDCNNGWHR